MTFESISKNSTIGTCRKRERGMRITTEISRKCEGGGCWKSEWERHLERRFPEYDSGVGRGVISSCPLRDLGRTLVVGRRSF